MYQSIKQKLCDSNKSSSQGDVTKTNYQIEVRALEARNLISADSNGFSDPYVKFSIRSELAPRKIKHFKTKYIKKNLNPVWNEGFIIPVEDPKTDFLHIEVWDKDFIKSDDPLGYIYFKLDNLEQGKEIKEWLKLVSVPHGDIFISIKALNFTSHNPLSLNQNADFDPTHHNLSQPSPFASQPYANISIDPATYSQSYLPPQSFQALPPAIDPHSYLMNQSALPLPYANQPPMMIIPQQQEVSMQAPNSPLVQSGGEAIRSSHSENLAHTATTQGFDLDYSQIKFLSRIGAGAFGEVWKGEWAGTTVAIKKILKADIDEEDLAEFSNEILLMSKLRHPNIVQFLGACLHPQFCLLTEFMDRGSLFHVLADDKLELKWDVRVQFATDIAKGMLYLHTRTPPIIHRDIKSLNILVTKDWKSTISDFGLTRIKDKTAPDTKVGSPAWSAPEVLRSEEYNEKADVYSYAIVLWEIITRKTPYEELSNPMQLIGQVAYQKPSLRPPIPECPVPEFTKLMIDCWNDTPNDRPDFHSIFETLKSISKSLQTAE